MDEIVKQAMAKWPDVPHCYDWLALDARGCWRMRDERAQQLKLAGDKVQQPALRNFINRNYGCDARGCWYFQNGPQRVYVALEAAPYIAHTDPRDGLVTQTGAVLAVLDGAWMSDAGELLVRSGDMLAQVDDRDLAQLIDMLELDGKRVSDEMLLAWLGGAAGALVLHYYAQQVPVERIAASAVASRFQFIRHPAAQT